LNGMLKKMAVQEILRSYEMRSLRSPSVTVRNSLPFRRFCPLLEFMPHFGDLLCAAVPT